jgi:hypothetical protein
MYISEKCSITTPFTFTCAHGKAEEEALVDSGATDNFMDQRMAQQLGIGTRKLEEPRRVFNVDGTENKAGLLTEYCTLQVSKGDKEILQRFYITSLGNDRAIFGYPWLRDFNPNIDWLTGEVKGTKTRIETVLLRSTRERALKRVIAAARRDEVWEEGDEIICATSMPTTHHTQEWAIEANRRKQNQNELPTRYQRHANLFSEKAACRFPPSRPENLHIQIKPSAPDTINCKVYPLTHAKGEAADKFIKENEKLECIEKSDSPWSTPMFFIKKKDGSYRPVQDYHMVNS